MGENIIPVLTTKPKSLSWTKDKKWIIDEERELDWFSSHRGWFFHPLVQEYQGSSVLGQFVTRFLLKETSTQLLSLQSSLDCAMEAVNDQGCTDRRTLKKPEDLPVQRVVKRPGRRIQKNMCLSPTDPYSGMLTTGTVCYTGVKLQGSGHSV